VRTDWLARSTPGYSDASQDGFGCIDPVGAHQLLHACRGRDPRRLGQHHSGLGRDTTGAARVLFLTGEAENLSVPPSTSRRHFDCGRAVDRGPMTRISCAAHGRRSSHSRARRLLSSSSIRCRQDNGVIYAEQHESGGRFARPRGALPSMRQLPRRCGTSSSSTTTAAINTPVSDGLQSSSFQRTAAHPRH